MGTDFHEDFPMDPEQKKNETEKKPETTKPEPKDNLVETRHSLRIGGKEFDYTVITGTIILKEETGDRGKKSEGEKPKAQFFFIAYTKDGVEDKSKRPVTFSFNGGPGSSSVWLHLGLLGPRRVKMDAEGMPLPPPYTLVDNEYSLLDWTDLVFIDPVSTGYSRPVEGKKAKEFHGYKEDIETVGDFIRLYTTRYQRWPSPKFLAGESYGTTRAAGLSGYLQERHGLYLNGIILISSILDFGTADLAPGHDLPYILYLPTFAATARYHGKLRTRKPLLSFLHEVEAFALGEYTLALMKGSTLPPRERAQIIRKLSLFTGLSEDYLDRTDLRINIFRFCKELLRDERRTIGRLDSRFKGIDRDAAGETSETDPSMSAVTGPYTATFYDYVRGELKYESDLPYEILTPKVWPWSYAEFENQFVNVAETLRKAISNHPSLKVHVANGYYDLATPYLATAYTFEHMGLDASLKENISMSYYEAGHMMYIHLPSIQQLRKNLVNFIQASLGKG
jgi:carboxypeptidase C (cathepsin A)